MHPEEEAMKHLALFSFLAWASPHAKGLRGRWGLKGPKATYVHTDPPEPGLFDINYWVTACNSDGCSRIDTENPARSSNQ